MTLYRLNLKLSQEFFTVISCFEIALRNKIDNKCISTLGNDWLKSGAEPNGVFDNKHCRLTQRNINDAVRKLGATYTHNKLVAELGFGFWRYLFAQRQYNTMQRAGPYWVFSRQSQPVVQQCSTIKIMYSTNYQKSINSEIGSHITNLFVLCIPNL